MSRPSRSRRPRWPLVIIAMVAVVLIAGGPDGVAHVIAGAIDRTLGQSSFDGPLPGCTIGDRAAPNATLGDWDRTLLDTEFALPPDYAPTDLVDVSEAGIDGDGAVRALVILDLDALSRAARNAGTKLSVESAYRSYAAQRRTFDSLVEAYGRAYALESAARPGHSEHQLGTTLDVRGGDAWLATNAPQFGFVLSYPESRSPAFTCYKPESWHFRYVGRRRASAIQASGLSPREWLWQHGNETP